MKKNVMMRVASIMLVLVLMTSSVISGTFAKYVTQNDVKDTARVAEWGVVITTSGSIFETQYANDDELEKDKDGNEIQFTVDASGEKVVAPGTKSINEMVFTIAGVPEVAVNVDIDLNVKKNVYLSAGTHLDYTTGKDTSDTFTLSNTYQPLVFTLKNSAGDVLASGTIDQIKAYLETTISGNYAPNTNLATALADAKADGTYKLSWEWLFEQSNAIYDKADTYLGNVAANLTGIDKSVASVEAEVEFVITITQID